MILYCGIHLPPISDSRIVPSSGMVQQQPPEGQEEPLLIRASIDTSQRILGEICQQWETVHPHRIAFQRLSDEVKRMMDARSWNHAPNLPERDDSLPELPMEEVMEGTYDVNGNLWDVPFDVSTWDGLVEGDMDMRDVFGFDLGFTTGTSGWNTDI